MAALRRKAKMTQLDMAKALRRSQAEISRWETLDRFPFHMLDEIYLVFEENLPADVLKGISSDDLTLPWEEVVRRNARRQWDRERKIMERKLIRETG